MYKNMGTPIKKAFILINLGKTAASGIRGEIESFFNERNVNMVFQTEYADVPGGALKDVNMALSFGGDGTLLLCARACISHRIPILAVNLGNFGFITEISSTEWKQAYNDFVSGELGVSERMMVEARVIRDGRVAGSFSGLNDAVVGTVGVSRLIELKLYLSQSYVGRYRADGVIIATPTGSTAYSMGAGGPILHPEMEAFILNPICPFTLSNRPLVVSGDEIIEMELEQAQRTEAVLIIDGQKRLTLKSGDRVKFSRLKEKSLIIRSNRRNFYEVLRSKLNWSGEPNA